MGGVCSAAIELTAARRPRPRREPEWGSEVTPGQTQELDGPVVDGSTVGGKGGRLDSSALELGDLHRLDQLGHGLVELPGDVQDSRWRDQLELVAMPRASARA
jgi:hypothetical protein